jgi:hypothetical protein
MAGEGRGWQVIHGMPDREGVRQVCKPGIGGRAESCTSGPGSGVGMRQSRHDLAEVRQGVAGLGVSYAVMAGLGVSYAVMAGLGVSYAVMPGLGVSYAVMAGLGVSYAVYEVMAGLAAE